MQEYYCLQENNNLVSNQLEEMKNYSNIFEENHKKIETLKKKIEEKEKNLIILKENIVEINNKRNMEEELLDRQEIKKKI